MMARSSFIYSTFQGITKIADLTACSNLTVLYLYNNKLKSIEALDSAPNIQLLYLQNNKISRMGGLEKLKKLKKLYLTRNKVQVLEGLLENRCLEVFLAAKRSSTSALMSPSVCLSVCLSVCGQNWISSYWIPFPWYDSCCLTADDSLSMTAYMP